MLSKKLKKYLGKAYQVYVGDKPHAVVARIAKIIAKKVSYQKNREIIVKKETFSHFVKHFIDKKTKTVYKQKLFLFVKTINKPNEIYLSKDGKLRYFKQLRNFIENEVIIDKDLKLKNKSLVVTQFENNLLDKRDFKYSLRQKNTSFKVFLDSRGAPTYPSSNMLAQVPGIGSRLPRSLESAKSITYQTRKINKKKKTKL